MIFFLNFCQILWLRLFDLSILGVCFFTDGEMSSSRWISELFRINSKSHCKSQLCGFGKTIKKNGGKEHEMFCLNQGWNGTGSLIGCRCFFSDCTFCSDLINCVCMVICEKWLNAMFPLWYLWWFVMQMFGNVWKSKLYQT